MQELMGLCLLKESDRMEKFKFLINFAPYEHKPMHFFRIALSSVGRYEVLTPMCAISVLNSCYVQVTPPRIWLSVYMILTNRDFPSLQAD